MYSEKKISVIIPAYNASSYIVETIESVLNQTYQNIEIIVVDDGSTDDTVAIVNERFPSVSIFHQENSGGCSSPRNKGIELATGAFINVFDADDRMLPDKLESQMAFLESNPIVDIVFCDYINFSGDDFAPSSHFDTCKNLMLSIKRSNQKYNSIILEPASS
jgi:glycosyltransferase involved in cell wall biosynthesis